MSDPIYIIEAKSDNSAIAMRQIAGASVSAIPFLSLDGALKYTAEKVNEIKLGEAGLAR